MRVVVWCNLFLLKIYLYDSLFNFAEDTTFTHPQKKATFMAKSSGKPEKMYYTIGEVANMFHLNTSNIRFWEKEFDVINPRRNKKGNRYFTAKDVENFHIIYHLVKERGYTLNGAKEKLKKDHQSTEKAADISARLKKVRGFLVELKAQLDEPNE